MSARVLALLRYACARAGTSLVLWRALLAGLLPS